ncbi:TPA: ribose 5-phosphate isomerase B [bacterium]|nr:ribose 5-phosphate isomerase B [bacterium]
MKIAVGSDHRGFNLKCYLKNILSEEGHEILDFGCSLDTSSVDYPDFTKLVVEALMKCEVERGILICATGIGMCMTANKFRGVRAATVNDLFTARLSRLHNDANVLCLGSEVVGQGLAEEIVKVWLTTPFANEERHLRRIEKMEAF